MDGWTSAMSYEKEDPIDWADAMSEDEIGENSLPPNQVPATGVVTSMPAEKLEDHEAAKEVEVGILEFMGHNTSTFTGILKKR